MLFKDVILAIDKLNQKYLVIILELIIKKLDIYTLSEMARFEGKSRNGILNSSRYKKIEVGNIKLAIKGINEDKLPI